MRLKEQQKRGGKKDRRAGEDAVFERIHTVIISAAPVRHEEDDREFTDLRRLDTEHTDADPSVNAALLGREHQHEHQRKVADT